MPGPENPARAAAGGRVGWTGPSPAGRRRRPPRARKTSGPGLPRGAVTAASGPMKIIGLSSLERVCCLRRPALEQVRARHSFGKSTGTGPGPRPGPGQTASFGFSRQGWASG